MSNAAKKGDNSTLMRAYVAIQELEAKVEALERTCREPIAVLGLGCRFPGADGPEAFWELLRHGRDATRGVPPDRWDNAEFYDPAQQAPGKTYVERGGYLDDVAGFDTEFFGLSPRESARMDPQQRLLLEVSWEALEHAGLAPHTLTGSKAGVFFGLMNLDYPQLLLNAPPEQIDAFFGAGCEPSFLAGRLSYLLGLQGPSMVIATACSSSLVAVHLACQSLRLGECRLALAGGVNVIANPHANVVLCKMNALSPDGRCKTFDAAADGYGRGEGCGVVVLKRLSDAVKEGDNILAVIRGTAVNHGGPSGGLTVPSGPAQATVIRDAMNAAGVEPGQVGYVECHGTGTALGDPIELRALAAVLGERPAEGRCVIGSAKANIGHLESAAGVAGLIKVVLALAHETIPPQPLLNEVNPHIPWNELPLQVAKETVSWPRGGRRRIAGLSSFGLSGVNAHAIVEEAPLPEPKPSVIERPWHLLCLSARSESALRELAGRWASHLSEPLADIAFTANTGRTTFAHRLAVVAEESGQARAALAAFARGESSEGLRSQTVPGERPARVAFLFPGVRAQYLGMARQLYETQAVFRRVMDECAELFSAHLNEPLLSVLYPPPGASSRLEEPLYAQSALFAAEYALAELWRSWGVEPAAVLGYGTGEYAAACVAGVLPVEAAIRLLTTRAMLTQRHAHDSAMATVFASEAKVREILAAHPEQAALTAVNGPEEVVVSGIRQGVKAVLTRLERAGVRTEMWRVTQAFRSPLLEPHAEKVERAAADIRFGRSGCQFISGLTGRAARDEELADPRYWRRQACEPVRFMEGVAALEEMGIRVFVEAGPLPVLLEAGQACAKDGVWLPSLRPERDDWQQLIETLQTLWLEGVSVNWSDFDRGYPRRKLPLPSYPFQRQRCWIDGLGPTGSQPPASDRGVSPLLGRKLRTALDDEIWEARWGSATLPLFADHTVHGQAIAPGACFLAALDGGAGFNAENVTFSAPMPFPDGRGRTVQRVLSPAREGVRAFRFFSLGDADTWTLHVSGELRESAASPERISLAAVQGQCREELAPEEFYAALGRAGLGLGKSFRWLQCIWRGQGQALGLMREAHEGETTLAHFHPGLLDGCFQLAAAALPGEFPSDLYIPLGIGRFHFAGLVEGTLWCHASVLASENRETITADLVLFEESGRAVIRVEGLTLKRVTAESLRRGSADNPDSWLCEVRWQAAELPAAKREANTWLIVADQAGVGDALARRFQERGHACSLVAAGDEDGLQRLLTDEKPAGVIYLGGLDETDSCRQPLHLIQVLARLPIPPRLWLVTRGAQETAGEGASPRPAVLWGLGRTAARELPALRCTCVDLDPSESDPAPALLEAVLADDGETEIALRGGVRHVARLQPLASEPTGPLELRQQTAGLLDGLTLHPQTRGVPGEGEVEIEVRAAGLNFRDVLNALGIYPGDAGPLGGECAGVISAIGKGVEGLQLGQEVVALAPGCFRSFAVVRAELTASKPDSLSFEEAAAVPVTFLTAQHALAELAALQPGERVLIHAAAGGVGFAAVQLARRIGAEVYATASRPKHEFLRSLGVRHVFDSRSLSFADEVRHATNGEGVHVVLNSLTGEFIPASMQLLAPGGRFVEIGKTDVWDLDRVRSVRADIAYLVYALDRRTLDDSASVGNALRELLAGFASGALQPPPRHLFRLSEAACAFRFMAQARHTGKIVLTAKPAQAIEPNAMYLITGGLGGLGLEMARALVERGARHLLLISRRAPGPVAQRLIAELQQTGASIHAVAADVAEYGELARVLAEAASSMPPMRGVIHAAGILDDGVLLEQTPERFEKVLAPKVRGAWHLHELTKEKPLDFFVLFSSAASILGLPGQGNYAAGNAFLDALAHHRRACGLPALSINWGPWAEVGMAARIASNGRTWASQGTNLIPPQTGIALFFRLLELPSTQVGVLPIRWPEFLKRFAGTVPPLFAHWAREQKPERDGKAPVPSALLLRLQSAEPRERRTLLAEFIAAESARLLGPQAARGLEPAKPLQDLGLDSLMAVELRNVLGHALGQTLPAALLFNYPTIVALTDHLLADVLHLKETELASPTSAREPERILENIEQISDNEVDRLLSEMTGESSRREHQ